MTTAFRIQSASRDVSELLDPAQQVSVSYTTDTERAGVSGRESLESLAAHLVRAGVPFDVHSAVVTMRGPLSQDTPEDADLGEILIYPTEIVSVEPMTDRLADLIDAAADALYA